MKLESNIKAKEVKNMPILDATRSDMGKTITLQTDNGVNEKGESIYTNKSFSNIRSQATDADILNSANILGSLQEKELVGVILTEKNILMG